MADTTKVFSSLAGDPINTAVTAGRGQFTSIFRGIQSNAFNNDIGSRSRAYSTTIRGILINKEFLSGPNIDLTKAYVFQFNPNTLSDEKSTQWEARPYPGLAYNDYVWSYGGERIISFQLFLDNTPQSKYSGESLFFKPRVSSDVAPFIAAKSIPKGATSFNDISGEAHSITRSHLRGILPEVELLQSFLYPAPTRLVADFTPTPKFAEGGIVSSIQFRPPPTVVFSYGPFYLEGIIKSAPVNYTLFDQDLTPLRATVDIEFAVFEYENLENRLKGLNNG